MVNDDGYYTVNFMVNDDGYYTWWISWLMMMVIIPGEFHG